MDTMAYARALRTAGIQNVDASAEALKVVLDELCKERQRMQSDMAEIRKGIDAILHRMDIADLKLDGCFTGVDRRCKEAEAHLRTEIKNTALDLATMNRQNNRTIAIISAIVGLIILAVKFGNGLLP
ncbi:hypothetical protein TSH64_00105 [Azospirillum sp. TSH64]|nr:hypothetical protein TSH64_28425 [Azospirillum sp. TSH64]PWC81561.1 hypothetical protein TSH64_00105 [Azospirillum sp. TSH64]